MKNHTNGISLPYYQICEGKIVVLKIVLAVESLKALSKISMNDFLTWVCLLAFECVDILSAIAKSERHHITKLPLALWHESFNCFFRRLVHINKGLTKENSPAWSISSEKLPIS